MRNREAIVTQLNGTARQVEVPAPFGGLNMRDSRAAMPPQDALQFKNMIAEPGGVTSRLGYESFATGITGIVRFMKEFINGPTRTMVIAAGTTLYDVGVNGGTVSSLGTGLTNANFEGAILSDNMVLVNGADTPELYDGSTITTGSYSGDIATPGANTMDAIAVHKSRMYMWDSATSDFYYGATNAIQGAFTKFPLGDVSTTGGNLLIMETISRDGGSGPDDYAAFILDTGEVIVYQGSDPGTASSWALVGRFFIPEPINKRCAAKFAGDVLVLTKRDMVSLSRVMGAGLENQGTNIDPSKISEGLALDFDIYGNNNGWELVLYGKKSWAIANVPETTDVKYHQYVTVMSNGSPAYFDGWNATTFATFNSGLYFGSKDGGEVFKADSGFDDDGSNIRCVAQQAFSTFSIPNVKNVKNLTISYLYDAFATIGGEVAYDYNEKVVTNTSSSETLGAEWDDSDWDTAEWAGAVKVRNIKFSVAGTGRSVSIIIEFQAKGAQLKWLGSSLSMDLLSMI
jgi:hypothetical protein